MSLVSVPSSLMLPAYTPFVEPLLVDTYWVLLLPLVLIVALVYKTIKLDDLDRLPRQVAMMTAQILAFMIVAAGLIWLIVELA